MMVNKWVGVVAVRLDDRSSAVTSDRLVHLAVIKMPRLSEI